MTVPPEAPVSRRPSEADVVARTAAYLRARGYRTYIDPDGGSYFDLAVRKGDEVGLVEAKVGNARAVLVQALRRRAWADWVAVVLPSARSAQRLVARTELGRARIVGVWALGDDGLLELRAPAVRRGDDGPPAFAPLRRRLRDALDAIDRGELPAGVAWDGVPGEVRRASGGRRFAEWRLDESPD